VDTGATEQEEYFPLRATVDTLVDDRLARQPRAGYGLLVAHTHGHADHTAGDAQFADRPDTTSSAPAWTRWSPSSA
jgi:hydroxyacylglutathione hydrolase